MSKGTAIDLGLNEAYNDLFSTQAERDNAGRSYLTDISTAEISDFPNHPFHVRMDEEMERLVDSVKDRGVLSPVLVRPMSDGGYQMVSGHRRKRAAELAELPTLSCIVRELTDDEATIIMVDSNLQREKVLPSEKAFAYKMKLDAMKRQGQRGDLTSSPPGTKLGTRSNQELAEQSPDGKTQIHRYIRLTNLIQPLLDIHPTLIGANMLTIYPDSELYQEIQRGAWTEESEIEKYKEIRALVEQLTIPITFAALGASNAFQLYGELPKDKGELLKTLDTIIQTASEEQLRQYRTTLPHL